MSPTLQDKTNWTWNLYGATREGDVAVKVEEEAEVLLPKKKQSGKDVRWWLVEPNLDWWVGPSRWRTILWWLWGFRLLLGQVCMVWGRWVLRATWARDKKRKGEKNTRKERTFWKEQGEKGQRCKEQKTCPECQDQGWKARGSIEGEERQDKCNAISRVHQQKTQASLWESCWPKFWACEKKESQDSQGRREPAPTTAPTTVETFDQTCGEERHHGNQKILQAVQGWWEHHSKPRHEGPTERKPEGRQSDRMPPKHLLADPSLWGDFKNTLKRHSAF